MTVPATIERKHMSYTESPSSGRRWGWFSDIAGGRVPADELYGESARQWYPEDIAEVMATARTRPGRPLAVSVHHSAGSAGSARYARAKDSRWSGDDRYVLTTRLLRDPAHPQAAAVVLVFNEDHQGDVDKSVG